MWPLLIALGLYGLLVYLIVWRKTSPPEPTMVEQRRKAWRNQREA